MSTLVSLQRGRLSVAWCDVILNLRKIRGSFVQLAFHSKRGFRKTTFDFIFDKEQMHTQSRDIFDSHLTRVKVWIKAKVTFDEDQIYRRTNFSCRDPAEFAWIINTQDYSLALLGFSLKCVECLNLSMFLMFTVCLLRKHFIICLPIENLLTLNFPLWYIISEVILNST